MNDITKTGVLMALGSLPILLFVRTMLVTVWLQVGLTEELFATVMIAGLYIATLSSFLGVCLVLKGSFYSSDKVKQMNSYFVVEAGKHIKPQIYGEGSKWWPGTFKGFKDLKVAKECKIWAEKKHGCKFQIVYKSNRKEARK